MTIFPNHQPMEKGGSYPKRDREIERMVQLSGMFAWMQSAFCYLFPIYEDTLFLMSFQY